MWITMWNESFAQFKIAQTLDNTADYNQETLGLTGLSVELLSTESNIAGSIDLRLITERILIRNWFCTHY